MSDAIPDGAAGALTKKIGPLPGIAWVAVLAGVVWLVYLWRKRGAAAGNSAGATSPVPYSVGFSSADPAPGTNNYSGTVDTTPVGQPATSTNAQWARKVTDFLVGTGNYSAIDVSNALANYLSGKPLTDQQKSIIDTAVKMFQTPPEGVVPAVVETPAPAPAAPAPAAPAPAAPAPAPAPAPARPWYHDYTVQPGDSLSAIAHKFWGDWDWQRLYNDNREVVGNNPNLIYPGQVLKVGWWRHL